ncbi:MAG: rRNA maturation RNAse YbeY, partial [Verrucomicrobiota bacterium]|nr:rRNA maturation RNAse YbeY [Verrucomicrobiota bacterium]
MTPPQINVRGLQRKHRLDFVALQRFAEQALPLCLKAARRRSVLTSLTAVDILVISDRRMAALHRQFLGITGATDVLTFAHGEIFVSAETAAENA